MLLTQNELANRLDSFAHQPSNPETDLKAMSFYPCPH